MFDDVYEVIHANTPATQAIHHRIRYHVYCIERGYEDPAAFPDGEERDQWDDDSVKFVVRERVSGRCVGAIRLILPRAVDLPVEFLGCLSPSRATGLLRRQLGEVSRVCIIRAPEPWMYKSQFAPDLGEVSRFHEIDVLIGLLRAVMFHSLRRRIEGCYILVTDAFARLLRRLGLVLEQAGVAREHRGMRTPYLWRLRESLVSMSEKSLAARQMFESPEKAYRASYAINDDTVDPDSLLIDPVVRPRATSLAASGF